MKTLLLILSFTIMVNADYEIFESQTKEIGTVIKTETVFFDKYDSFGKNLSKGADEGLKRALFGGIINGLSSAGFGLIIGLINPFVMSRQMDQKYLQIIKMEDNNGNIAFKKTMFMGANKGNEYSEDEILKLINKGLK
jgi:hypothetical protein